MIHLIPEPQHIQMHSGSFSLSYQSQIVLESTSFLDYARLLQKEIAETAGFSPSVTCSLPPSGAILLSLNTNTDTLSTPVDESYHLVIKETLITAEASSPSGLLYAIQTLRQIIRQCGTLLPCLSITDSPRFAFRGFYHDVTRGRIQTLENLKKLADSMSFYKLNQLQLYVEHTYLFSEYSEVWRDNTPITAEEIMELDAYCKKLHIDLVPSIANFGHMYHMLRSKTLRHLCELEHPETEEFSLIDRMAHHTINVSDPRSTELSLSIISEYMSLFSSPYFNICGDETFDLGKGKSKELMEQIGLDEMYMNYIQRLCEFIVNHGKIPMFWGDIIAKFPQMISRLPNETICLNWGYAPNQSDENIRALHAAGAQQILCSGTNSWNHIAGRLRDGYENITRMCRYANDYFALGILNTDWGDFGHINPPEFSLPAMIYGAAFSWNPKILSFEEINKKISLLEYQDRRQQLVSLMVALSQTECFSWFDMVYLKEKGTLPPAIQEQWKTSPTATLQEISEAVQKQNRELFALKHALQEELPFMDSSKRSILRILQIAADGIALCNELLYAFLKKLSQEDYRNPSLAEKLEHWMYHYQILWRENSKEAELQHIEEVLFWYADFLR